MAGNPGNWVTWNATVQVQEDFVQRFEEVALASDVVTAMMREWRQKIHEEFRRLASGGHTILLHSGEPLKVGKGSGPHYVDSLQSDERGSNKSQRKMTFWSDDPKAALFEYGSSGPWVIKARNRWYQPTRNSKPRPMLAWKNDAGEWVLAKKVTHPKQPALHVIETAIKNVVGHQF